MAVLLSAYVSQTIGIAAIFGAFLVGLIMPRYAGLTEDVRGRFEDFVVAVLLPLFFVVTGLKTDVGTLNRPELWLLTLLLIAIAIAGKWLGAMLAARYSGFSLRDSAAIGALMNTRGLTELIVLNIGLSLGMISPAAVHDARRDGARDDVHDRACAAADRPEEGAVRAARGGASPGHAGARRKRRASPRRCGRSSSPRRTAAISRPCWRSPCRSRGRCRRASS